MRVLIRERREGQGQRSEDAALLTLTTKEGATSQGMQVSYEAGKDRKWILSYNLQKEPAPTDALILGLVTSKNCRIKNLWCFKSLSVWKFVTAARGY